MADTARKLLVRQVNIDDDIISETSHMGGEEARAALNELVMKASAGTVVQLVNSETGVIIDEEWVGWS